MNHCKDCRHWDTNGGAYTWFDDEGDEQAADARRTCKGVPFLYRGDTKRALAVVTDGSGYTGALWTSPDFGCVLWEPIEPATVGSESGR